MFSVIIPNYNQQIYVQKAIQSVLDQTCRDFELIVVDDGSTDASRSVIEKFKDRVKIICQENKGLAAARNIGIQAARGEFVSFLDADDIWLPTYLETILSLITEHSGASIYYSRAQSIDNQGNALPQIFGASIHPVNTRADMFETLLKANYLIPSTITARKDVIADAGYFDQTLSACEDWDLWLRIAPDHQFVGTNKILVRYRVHSESLSSDVDRMRQAKLAVVEKQFGVNDGLLSNWSLKKRRAYSGLFRYLLITALQREGNSETGVENLQKALSVDSSIVTDLELFYELALGNQPAGYRGSKEKIDIHSNAEKVLKLIREAFHSIEKTHLDKFKSNVFGTAYYGIGMVAYTVEDLEYSRHCIWRAGKHRPSLWFASDFTSIFIKSMLGHSVLGMVRCLKKTAC